MRTAADTFLAHAGSGHCGETTEHQTGDCDAGQSGAWGLPPTALTLAQAVHVCSRRCVRWCARCTQSGLGRPVGTIVCLHSDRLSLAREVNLSRDFSWISNFQIDVLIAPSLVRAKLSQACWQLPKMNEGRDCITAARVWATPNHFLQYSRRGWS